MAYLDLIGHLSTALSQTFIELHADLPIKPIRVRNGKLEVDDMCFAVLKQRFLDLIRAASIPNQDSSFTEHMWRELNSGQGMNMLEL